MQVTRAVMTRITGATTLAVAYFAAVRLGESLGAPPEWVVAIPAASVLAVLLRTGPQSGWLCVLGALSAHVVAYRHVQIVQIAIDATASCAQALLGATAVARFARIPAQFCNLRTVIVFILSGVVIVPLISSAAVAGLQISTGAYEGLWPAMLARTVASLFIWVTLVPAILAVVMATRGANSLASGEDIRTKLLVTGLLLSGPSAAWTALLLSPHARPSFLILLIVMCTTLLLLAAALCEWHVARASLAESEARFRSVLDVARRQVGALHEAVLDSINARLAVVDRNGVLLEVNHSWRSAIECCAGAMGDVLPGKSLLQACRAVAQRGDAAAAEVVHALEELLAGASTARQLELTAPHAAGTRWFELSIEPLRRREGGAILMLTEVTARKEAENEAVEQRAELAHLSRAATLGELSGAIAHEINQPLSAILGNSEAALRLLDRDPNDPSAIRELLRDVIDDAVRAGEVIHRLRTMLRKGQMESAPFDLDDAVGEVVALARSTLTARRVRVERECAGGLARVFGDRVQIQQVILNLLMNAVEAMQEVSPAERCLRITTRRIPDARQLELIVADRGPGIDEKLMEHIFRPFVTTKPQGLGLGLAICTSIVRAHGGKLRARNDPRGGAILHVTLPLHA